MADALKKEQAEAANRIKEQTALLKQQEMQKAELARHKQQLEAQAKAQQAKSQEMFNTQQRLLNMSGTASLFHP